MTVTAQQAYAFGVEQLQTPTPQNGIVVIYSSQCPHCHRSLENTNMATQTSNGTPIKWIDIANPEGMAAFQGLNGVTQENGTFMVNGRSINAVPTTLGMQQGVAGEVLQTGVIESGDLNMFAAMIQSREPAVSTGNSVPHNAEAQTKQIQR